MKENKIIELKDISIFRGKKQILHHVNWSTYQGQHWFILGNNGSGKTTLLEILMGYLWPQEGSVFILGQQYGKICIPDLRKKIGYVSTWIFNRMYKRYNVEDIVASGIDGSTSYLSEKNTDIVEQVHKMADAFSCVHLLEKSFGSISSGEQFKVILCRALINQPELLILDEPFAFLDIGARQKAYRLIEQIAIKPSAPQIVLVTHHLEDIRSFYTQGMIIKDGKIFQNGSKESILEPDNLNKVFDISDF
ncbi:MAG: ATP-binding cassette domain-containing protein [Candidatus Omnitrophica bacterium]|nr:ATP-binding cassette domain-containing protein [Candidatus Omnitrophota bacterium]